MVAQLKRALPALALLLIGCGAGDAPKEFSDTQATGGAKSSLSDWAAKNPDNGKPGNSDK